MTSYITTQDLQSLNLQDDKHGVPHHSDPSSSLTSTTRSHDSLLLSSPRSTNPSSSCESPDEKRSKRVKFSRLCWLVELAGEGEIEGACLEGYKKDLGKKSIGVKTYTVQTPSLSNAWNSVRSGISAIAEPLLNNQGGSTTGVVSSRNRRESSPERQWKCPERTKPRRRGSSISSFGSDRYDPEEEDIVEDEVVTTTTMSGPTKLMIKIPTVKRSCSRPCLLTKTSRSILRGTSPSTTTTAQSLPLPLPIVDKSPSEPNLSSSASPRKSPRPIFSTSPSSVSQTLQPTSPHPSSVSSGQTIPLTDCCRNCCRATEYGFVSNEDGYVEHFSRGAIKMREEQEKERLQREEWKGQDERRDEVKKEKKEKMEGRDEEKEEEELVEEELRGSKLGEKARGVDELQLEKDKRHVKRHDEKVEEEEELESSSSEKKKTLPQVTTPPIVVEEYRNESPSEPLVDDVSHRPPFSSSSSPPTETLSPQRQLSSSLTAQPILPPPPMKRRSSSFTQKLTTFGSSLFGAGMGTGSNGQGGNVFGGRIA